MDSERGRERRDSSIEKRSGREDAADSIRGNDVKGRLVCTICQIGTYIETIGLPLLEARSVGAPILAADCLYARDGVGDYEKAEFFETFDAKKLSEMMERFCR